MSAQLQPSLIGLRGAEPINTAYCHLPERKGNEYPVPHDILQQCDFFVKQASLLTTFTQVRQSTHQLVTSFYKEEATKCLLVKEYTGSSCTHI